MVVSRWPAGWGTRRCLLITGVGPRCMQLLPPSWLDAHALMLRAVCCKADDPEQTPPPSLTAKRTSPARRRELSACAPTARPSQQTWFQTAVGVAVVDGDGHACMVVQEREKDTLSAVQRTTGGSCAAVARARQRSKGTRCCCALPQTHARAVDCVAVLSALCACCQRNTTACVFGRTSSSKQQRQHKRCWRLSSSRPSSAPHHGLLPAPLVCTVNKARYASYSPHGSSGSTCHCFEDP